MKRNVVLTYASGYPLDVVEPFLASWARHVPSAELVMFADGNDDAFHDAAARHGVAVLDPPRLRDYPLLIARNFAYREFLRTHRRNFDAVLLTDSRDVVFQGDPFAVRRGAPVAFAVEDMTIEACRWNSMWTQMVYGGEIRARIGGETTCCAGTTIGDRDGVLAYLDLMCGESDTRSTEWGEQCYHNYIAYVLRPDFVEIDRLDRIVQTIGYTAPDRVRFADGRLLVDGAAAPVVHQYDRHVELAKAIRAHHRLAA